MAKERKYLKNPCSVCGQEQIGLHHHYGSYKKNKIYLTKGDVEFLKKDGELHINKKKTLVYVPRLLKKEKLKKMS